jgi:hypothetical protein
VPRSPEKTFLFDERPAVNIWSGALKTAEKNGEVRAPYPVVLVDVWIRNLMGFHSIAEAEAYQRMEGVDPDLEIYVHDDGNLRRSSEMSGESAEAPPTPVVESEPPLAGAAEEANEAIEPAAPSPEQTAEAASELEPASELEAVSEVPATEEPDSIAEAREPEPVDDENEAVSGGEAETVPDEPSSSGTASEDLFSEANPFSSETGEPASTSSKKKSRRRKRR